MVAPAGQRSDPGADASKPGRRRPQDVADSRGETAPRTRRANSRRSPAGLCLANRSPPHHHPPPHPRQGTPRTRSCSARSADTTGHGGAGQRGGVGRCAAVDAVDARRHVAADHQSSPTEESPAATSGGTAGGQANDRESVGGSACTPPEETPTLGARTGPARPRAGTAQRRKASSGAADRSGRLRGGGSSVVAVVAARSHVEQSCAAASITRARLGRCGGGGGPVGGAVVRRVSLAP